MLGSGPGAEMRKALGVAVFFGMIGVTVFGLLFTPSFYVISRKGGDWAASKLRRKRAATDDHPPALPAPEGKPA